MSDSGFSAVFLAGFFIRRPCWRASSVKSKHVFGGIRLGEMSAANVDGRAVVCAAMNTEISI